jgi:acyl-CoA reductase-like NAD-dependent aldehyde dehydrogenase
MTTHLYTSGVPPGVVNMVFGVGPRAGEALVKHPNVPLISFTGSTAVGQRIQAISAPFVKKLSLEVYKQQFKYDAEMLFLPHFQLGGKNPGVVFDDTDLDKCLPTMIRSSFANQGEICLTTSRIFVQEGIYDKFVERFVERTK